jgi:hypothetical protein
MGFGSPLGEQLACEADPRRHLVESTAESTEDFRPRLQDEPSAVRADGHLGPFVEAELATELDGHDESPLRTESNGDRGGCHVRSVCQ